MVNQKPHFYDPVCFILKVCIRCVIVYNALHSAFVHINPLELSYLLIVIDKMREIGNKN